MPSTLKPKQPKPTAAHRRLEVFIGDWHAEGTSYGDGQDAADPRASSVPWTSDESYEWLPGSFFVLPPFFHSQLKLILSPPSCNVTVARVCASVKRQTSPSTLAR